MADNEFACSLSCGPWGLFELYKKEFGKRLIFVEHIFTDDKSERDFLDAMSEAVNTGKPLDKNTLAAYEKAVRAFEEKVGEKLTPDWYIDLLKTYEEKFSESPNPPDGFTLADGKNEEEFIIAIFNAIKTGKPLDKNEWYCDFSKKLDKLLASL